MKIKSIGKLYLLTSLLMLVLVAAMGGLASAATSAKSSSPATPVTTPSDAAKIQAVAQSYGTSGPLQQGLIVQLDPKNSANVVPSTYKDAKKMLGVVVGANSAPVSLSSGASGQQAYVVTTGRYSVLVSTQNGNISAGDFVSISAIDGVGMKTDTTEVQVLGRAVGGFSSKSATNTTTLKTSTNKQIKVAVGSIQVDIGITRNPQLVTSNSGVPAPIQKLAISIIGKPIGAPQLYVSLAIMVAGFGITASLLYGGIESGMSAIGRNPLARQSIMRNLIQVIITSFMIFIGCLVAVYLILKI